MSEKENIKRRQSSEVKISILNEEKENPSKKKKVYKKKKDPVLVHHVELSEDFYALVWNACRKETWEGEKAEIKHKEKVYNISLTENDDRTLMLSFLFFIFIVIITVAILLYESFASDVYVDVPLSITILRITLVGFAQQKLKPEIFQGISLLRYSFRFSEKFSHPLFAKFVAFCQATIGIITFWAIFFFVCMADEALELIMNFAGLAVISELDDWVGEQIMSERVHTEYEEDETFKEANIDFSELNEKMGVFKKLCIVSEDLEIVDDQNMQIIDNWIYSLFSTITDYIPYSLIPLLTVPCQSLLAKLSEHKNSKE